MNDNRSRNFWFGRTAQTIVGGLLVALAAVAVSGTGSAQGNKSETTSNVIQTPTTPTDITPPEGNSAFLVGHAFGTQGYVCLPDGTGGTSWTATRPPRSHPLYECSSGSRSRSSPTSSASMQTPTRSRPTRYPSGGTRRGRVPSIAAGCGQ